MILEYYSFIFALSCKHKADIRHINEANDCHVPPFLIASITTKCNLHCKGCYARENKLCSDSIDNGQLTKESWNRIFSEADEMGVSFILLAGGEPLMRKDVIECAANYHNILFPVFTNSTLIDSSYIQLFKKNMNILPVLSIEGSATDERRGEGIYSTIVSKMNDLKDNNILFGTSITVTTENLHEITSKDFINDLYSKGCKGVVFVEYVPITKNTEHLALGDDERSILENNINSLKSSFDMLFVSFPGDEKNSGGCLAAGRGFFHINPYGGAEPCPFSPYSDINLKTTSLKEAMNSPLFTKIRQNDLLQEDHTGGCVLYKYRDEVEKLVSQKA